MTWLPRPFLSLQVVEYLLVEGKVNPNVLDEILQVFINMEFLSLVS